jgi:hypothetical protein
MGIEEYWIYVASRFWAERNSSGNCHCEDLLNNPDSRIELAELGPVQESQRNPKRFEERFPGKEHAARAAGVVVS